MGDVYSAEDVKLGRTAIFERAALGRELRRRPDRQNLAARSRLDYPADRGPAKRMRPKPAPDRRQFLRGATYSLALPLLPSLPGGLRAEERARAKRLVSVGAQLGWYKPAFFASSKESPLIEPFDEAGVGDQVTTISGLDHKGPTGNGHALVYTLYTGQVLPRISLDQYVAPRLGADTRYESMQLCAGEATFNAPLSFTSTGVAMPATIRPSVVYAKIFGGGAAELERQNYLISSGRSLLDQLTGSAKSMHRKADPDDSRKLDEYLTSVRAVERKLERRKDWLDRPFPEPDPKFRLPAEEVIGQSSLLENEDLMWDLMALAVKNDSSRVFSFQIPLANSALLMNGNLMSRGYHGYSHHGNDKEKIAALVSIERAHMQGAARFMKALKETPDGDGRNMLDSTILLIGSSMADASTHTRANYPLMVAGGGLKHKRHVSCGTRGHDSAGPRNEMACDLFVTVLQQLGFEVDQFSSSLSDLNGILT